MIDVTGYRIYEKIYSSSNSNIYKAKSEENNTPVIIKILKKEYPTPEKLNKFKTEYDICNSLNICGVIKNYDLVKYGHTLAVIMEDFEGVSLDSIISKKKIDIKLFLEIAIKIASIIGEIHKKHIIHKDIKPHNILLNQKTNEIKIIDFSIATQLSKENQNMVSPERIEGTLAYISPEQTGRMNRSIDYRTDYYSLGVTLYELITGRLPFIAKDSMELIHCHIAKIPDPPNKLNKKIHIVISKIILKLLNKNAEDRYQSIYGLIYDLEKCYNMLIENGKIEDFEIAKNDIPDKFQIPEKLYGREEYLENLLNIFDTVCSGKKRAVFFGGISGIGKSSLINEIQKPVVEKKGYFIDGKYEQFERNVPYSAIIQAFQSLVKQIITENNERIKIFKDEILEAVGNNGKVIIDVIPELELIIGSQPYIEQLGINESLNRFNLVFQNFIKVFSKQSHPLVLFIDDLQWADGASIKLIQNLLMDHELEYFLFIGAYRDNEINIGHPLSIAFDNIGKNDVDMVNIKLPPFTSQNISSLLSDSFKIENDKVLDLAKLILEKTGGNPFFVLEFIKQLCDDELIKFDKGWKWQLDKIQQSRITDNVVELMAGRIKKLPEKTLDTLKIACCIGIKFPFDVLSAVYEKSEKETLDDITEAINQGIIVKTGNEGKFIHDRVLEASYSLISQEEQEEIHYKIGKRFMLIQREQIHEDKLFNIVNQLNLAKNILNKEEKFQLIELNYQAGLKSKSNEAFDASLNYFNIAINLLDNESWQKNYKRTFQIYLLKAEAEFLNGNFEESEKILKEILKNCNNDMDKVDVYRFQIIKYAGSQKYREALLLVKQALKILGVNIKEPEKTTVFDIIKELFISKLIIRNRKITNLKKFKTLTNTKILQTLDIMIAATGAAFFYDTSLMTILVIKTTMYSMIHGFSVPSSFGLTSYGVVLNGMLGDAKNSIQFGKAGIELAKKYDNNYFLGRNSLIYACFEHYWLHPLKECMDILKTSLSKSLESGDLEYSAYSLNTQAVFKFLLSTNLKDAKDEIMKLSIIDKRIKQSVTIIYKIWSQMIIILSGTEKNENVLKIKGSFFDEDIHYQYLIEVKNLQAIAGFYCNKIFLAYLFDDFANGLDMAREKEKIIISGSNSFITLPLFYFFYALLIKERWNYFNDKEKKYYLKKYKFIIKKYSKWAKDSSCTFEHNYKLILAEYNSIIGKNQEAMSLYDEAIKCSKNNEFINFEAIANECAAKFYLLKNMKKIAQTYLVESIYCYTKWDASIKVKYMEKKYSYMFHNIGLEMDFDNLMEKNIKSFLFTPKTDVNNDTINTITYSLDINSVMKANQAISSEIDIDTLIIKVIKIAMKITSCERVVLILQKDEAVFVEAEGIGDKESVLLKSIPIYKYENIPLSIVSNVLETKKNLILNEGIDKSLYAKDVYIIKKKPKSIICLSILNQSRLVGILYIENNVFNSYFTREQIEVLKVLSTQIAISIENTQLIEDMKEKERLKQEMEIAQKIQTSLCPKHIENEELEISAMMQPAEEVSGDYYDIGFDKDNKLWIAIGDVSGHGVTPGLIMIMAETAFNTKIKDDSITCTPKDVIIDINKALWENIRLRLEEFHFMTMILLKYLGNGEFLYSGSHLDILIYRAKTKSVDIIKTYGTVLSLKEDITKDTNDNNFKIDIDDVVVLYTDGIIEARKAGDKFQLWGIENLQILVEQNGNKSCKEIKQAILQNVLEWCDNKPIDDITIVVLRRER